MHAQGTLTGALAAAPGLVFLVLMTSARHHELVCNMLPGRVAKRLALGKQYVESFSDVTILFSE